MDNPRVTTAARYATLVLAVHFVAVRFYILERRLAHKGEGEDEETRKPSILQLTIQGSFLSTGLLAILGVLFKSQPILYFSAIWIGAYAATGVVSDEMLLGFFVGASILLLFFLEHSVFVVEVCASVSAIWGALKITNENNTLGFAQFRKFLNTDEELPFWTKFPVLPLLLALIIYVESLRDEGERARMEMQKNLVKRGLEDIMEEEEEADCQNSDEKFSKDFRSSSIFPEREEHETQGTSDKIVSDLKGFLGRVGPKIREKSEDIVPHISVDPEGEDFETKETSEMAFCDSKGNFEEVEFITKDEEVLENSIDSEQVVSENKASEENEPDISESFKQAGSETKVTSTEIISEASENPKREEPRYKDTSECIIVGISGDPKQEEAGTRETSEEIVNKQPAGNIPTPRDRGDTTSEVWSPRYSKLTLTKRHQSPKSS